MYLRRLFFFPPRVSKVNWLRLGCIEMIYFMQMGCGVRDVYGFLICLGIGCCRQNILEWYITNMTDKYDHSNYPNHVFTKTNELYKKYIFKCPLNKLLSMWSAFRIYSLLLLYTSTAASHRRMCQYLYNVMRN